jgi:hypothetical protein
MRQDALSLIGSAHKLSRTEYHVLRDVYARLQRAPIPPLGEHPNNSRNHAVISSFQIAQSLGFKGDYRAWEDLLRVHE